MLRFRQSYLHLTLYHAVFSKAFLDPQPTAKLATLDFRLKNNIQAAKNQSTHKIEAEMLACTVEGNSEN